MERESEMSNRLRINYIYRLMTIFFDQIFKLLKLLYGKNQKKEMEICTLQKIEQTAVQTARQTLTLPPSFQPPPWPHLPLMFL
ncbi:uncharacterized protein MONOS_11684 [Monocercomonoides exilis]|uniref:uncharacterized protein n=1 Tax=Monocercomonoides exilis TaxID=2049356 RepID=UPI00355AA33A|nr:hypothetical protein MONOS_11684 [Monocercomonoides exilis]|eukprot:MONOS_11684.1-p1 / transcript=MONOS_11684.1 / gene=MONOS_11684 / organism=Monocercomonoides_exilis_PA203 / gene_product=unspecified product / transcript_product=unspecified product / location=Mono_scaffold00601:21431-21951(+) / protein_length=83 / sequence_SO=supercontig / SO=protein_coding / is_pseudo=false